MPAFQSKEQQQHGLLQAQIIPTSLTNSQKQMQISLLCAQQNVSVSHVTRKIHAHVQGSGCVGRAKCMKKSSGSGACLRPRSGLRAGRCKADSWRAVPRQSNVHSALSGRAPSGALLVARLGCMR